MSTSRITGFGDCVRCFFCGGGLRNWEHGDTPWVEHARWYPNCEYLRRRKGDLFIEMHQTRNQEEPFAPPPPTVSSQPSPVRQPQRDAYRNEMEYAMGKTSTEDEKDDIAVRSVLEMGYAKTTIASAVEHLRKQGKSKHTATDIMAVILDQEEKQTSAPSTTTNTTHTPSQTGASASIASAESQSLFKENQTLKEGMLCKICLDKDACMVYLPCGHMVTCQECAPTIRKCCICRKLIHGTVKAYL